MSGANIDGPRRPLGTMIAYGFPRGDVGIDLEVVARLGATHLEILPDWRNRPEPGPLRERVADLGLTLWSAHGCWGGRAIEADRVDLGSLDESTRLDSVADIRRCLDWLAEAGGSHLVVHPGGLSEPADRSRRRDSLTKNLAELAPESADRGLTLCVENMPAGVHPGSRMADLAAILDEIDHPALGLCLDTGHARITADPAVETRDAGPRLRTTHVHDNDGRRDVHLPPGDGSIDWEGWALALDSAGYDGPIVLECIRILRQAPDRIDDEFLRRMARLRGG